jgi:hypothetical protein
MTESTNSAGLVFPNGEPNSMQILAARVEKKLPDAYRLVGHHTDSGFTELRLQGYFTWQQGWSCGGEWKDINTVDADTLNLNDDKPYGQLY